jgi:ribosome modulation factor
MNLEAYDIGYDAYWDGAEISENPYDVETEADANKSWEDGWRKAREHDYDESDG